MVNYDVRNPRTYPRIICTDELLPNQGHGFVVAADIVIRDGRIIKERPLFTGRAPTADEIDQAVTITREITAAYVRHQRAKANAIIGPLLAACGIDSSADST